MYKLVIDISWIDDEKVTVESNDFEKIQIIQEFIAFQEEHGWAVDYEAVDCDEDGFEEDTEEEEIPHLALNAHEPL
jgi:hypothetical protein